MEQKQIIKMPDFVVVGEFNEKLGPETKLILTSTGTQNDIKENFDVDHFVLRVMSVELNTDPEDVDFITTMELPEYDLHALVQHISLQDLYARGYVRRIVVSYLTQDSHHKLLNYFNLFQGYFQKVARLLREYNLILFESDLQKRIADLKFTEAEITRTQVENSSVSPSSSQIRESIEEMAILYHRMNDPNYKTEEEEYEKMLHGDSSQTDAQQSDTQQATPGPSEEALTLPPPPPDYTPKMLSNLQHPESLTADKTIRTLEQIAGQNWPVVVSQLQEMLQNLQKPDIVLYLENQDLMAMSQPDSLLKLGFTATLNFNFKDIPWYHSIDYEKFFNEELYSTTTDKNGFTKQQHQRQGSGEQPRGGGGQDTQSPPHDGQNQDPGQGGHGRGPGQDQEQRAAGGNEDPYIAGPPGVPEDHKGKDQVREEEDLSRDPDEGVYIESFGALLWSYSSHNAGVGLLALRDQGYSFTSHLIFSLLKGRPVVIQGKKEHEMEVRSIIQALSVFVANTTTSLHIPEPQVVPWFTENLQLAHLAHIKLVGLNKKSPIPLAVQKYVTIFNWELKTLHGPGYNNGEFILRILNDKKHWPNDSTYLAYVHSQLYEMAILACMCYHECCVGIPPHFSTIADPTELREVQGSASPSPSSSNQTSVHYSETTAAVKVGKENQRTFGGFSPLTGTVRGPPGFIVGSGGIGGSLSLSEVNLKYAEREQAKIKQQQLILQQRKKAESNFAKQRFLKKFNVKENDAEIIQYFTEVVKMQQSAFMKGPSKSPIIKLDYSQVFQFENKPKQRHRF